MIFEDSFFEEEIRSEFLVTDKRKRVWAVELNLLEILDDICKRHGLRYFVDYGTLLGAVRHEGFIPWDDDIDVTMFRDDYEKFKQVAAEEIKEPYFFQNVYTDNRVWAFSKIRDSRTSAIEFPDIPAEKMNQGIFIDIFPLDDVPDGINMQSYIKDMQRELWATIVQPQVVLNNIQRGHQTVCDVDLSLDMIRLPIRERMKEFEAFNEWQFGNSTKINFITDELCDISPSKEKQWYESVVYLPFENIKVPAPVGYDEILKCQYGDYRKFVRNGSAHEGIYLDPDTPYYLYKGWD